MGKAFPYHKQLENIMFVIKIHYRTGDSLNTYAETEEVGTVFATLEEAKEGLKAIEAHHKFSLALSKCRTPDARQRLITNMSSRPWFNKEEPQMLFMLNGRSVHAFWLGYFETLHWAKIELMDSWDTKYEP